MSARSDILDLMARYGFAIDTGNFEAFYSLFEHAEWTVDGTKPRCNREDFEELWSGIQIYEDGTPRTKHVASNVLLEIDDEAGKAKGESYVTVSQQTESFPLQTIFIGHYFDEFEQVDGEWRFTKRFITHALVGDMTAHLETPGDVVAASG